MMKKIFILLLLTIQLFGSAVSIPIVGTNKGQSEVYIKLPSVDIGLSGVVVHQIDASHSVILKQAEVISFDKEKQRATLALTPFQSLQNDALPHSDWKISPKDKVVLAIGYKRALLIAPTEEIYHKITQKINLEWQDSDLFAVILSTHGHPTPLKDDIVSFSDRYAVGLLVVYLDNKLYTLDAKSLKILSVGDALFEEKDKKNIQLPFYSNVKEIEANWFGAGSEKLKAYAPYYKKLLKEYNPNKIK